MGRQGEKAMAAKGLKSFGRYGAIGFELLLSIAVGYYLGAWLDRKLGTKWIALAGFILGCYAGFRALFRTAKRMTKDIERDEALERGEDPWRDEYVEDKRDDDAPKD
jgi:F0F1-type ATP synthase assembly protein I